MTAAELREAMLAEQRHTVVDLDPDSRHLLADTRLCVHGRPLVSARLNCPDCKSCGHHTADYVVPYRETGVNFCRGCGQTMGVHGERGAL
jgi:hypothetical protein